MRLLIRLALALGRIAAGLVLALLVFLTGIYFEVRGALPSYTGKLEAKGLKAPIEILRDKNGVPHILAGSLEDAAFGLGYVHAQDRFWQMELLRRLGQGRLAELVPPMIVGRGLIDTDRTMRGLGLYRRAAESVNALSPAARGQLDSYAAGVNLYLADADQQFGVELTLARVLSGGRYRPDSWQPADSLIWAKLMAMSLDGNWRSELLRLRLSRRVNDEGLQLLFSAGGESRDATLSMVSEATRRMDLDRLYKATSNPATDKREASNEWVLSGAHTVSGKPLLANDPHLGLAFPGTWYLARLVGPGFDLRGASVPGAPAIVLGHNGTVGWGFTTTGVDNQDLFVERVDQTDPSRYITPDGSRPFVVREETIRVLWGDPVQMRVRETRHGPVINDFTGRSDDITPQGHVLALQAVALDAADTSAEGFLRLGMAQNWDEFLQAARRIQTPMQNIVYGDTAGNIGLISPAKVPIRRKGDGWLPVPGWTPEFDWAGFVPFDDLPRVYNPASGIIVNANSRIVPDDYRHFITRDWAEPYRQRRANQLLREVERHPVYGMIAIQVDNLAPDAAELLPLLLRTPPRTARASQAHELMGRWNRFMLANRPEALIYNAWLSDLNRAIFADELGPELFADMQTPYVAALLRVLREHPGWCDDRTTQPVETCDDQIATSLERALDWIARRHGPDIASWQWGNEHAAAHRHPLFDGIPLLRRLASVRFPSDGGMHTLNRLQPSYRGDRPFEAVHGAGYKGVYDFANLDNSRFAMPLGQSGNMLSPWARSFVEPWQKIAYIEIAGTRAENARGAIGSLTIAPPAR